MFVVNKVIRFKISSYLDYKDLYKFATKIYVGRPTMIKIKINGNTVIIFRNMKGRIMGSSENMNETLSSLPFDVEDVKIQTLTFTDSISQTINLWKLNLPFFYEGEIFPAAAYIKFQDGAHINIFHTGKLVLTGVKSEDEATKIFENVKKLLLQQL